MQQIISALENQLASAVDIRDKVHLRLRLAHELRFLDIDRAIALCEDAVEMAGQRTPEGIAYQEGQAESLYQIGRLNLQASDYNLAFKHLTQSLEIYSELDNQEGKARVTNAIGDAHYYLGGYVDALDYYQQALTIFREIGLRNREAKVLNDIGSIHLTVNEAQTALEYPDECLEICRDEDLKETEADALNNSSAAYLQLGDYKNAMEKGQKSLSISTEIGDRSGETESLNSIGDIYIEQNLCQDALDIFHQSFEIAREIGNRYEMVRALQKIGDVHRKLDQPDEVLSVMHQALVIAQEIEARQLQFECHEILAEIYKQLNDYERALAHFEQFLQLKEAVFNSEADRRLKQLEIAHQVETARHEAIIYQLRYGDLQQEIAAREQLIQDLDAFAHMVAHDLKNPLQTMNVSLYLLLTKLSEATDDVKEVVQTIQRSGDKMNRIIEELLILASVRQQDISPKPIDMARVLDETEGRLSGMINEYDAKIVRPKKWPIVLGYAPWIEEVWDNYISNAIKYGGTPPVIELGADRIAGGFACFWVKDNGNGIQPNDQADLFAEFYQVSAINKLGHGLGLSIVRRIIEKLGGTVWVDSTGNPAEGSIFCFTLPLNEETQKDL